MSDVVVFRHLADKYDTKLVNMYDGYCVRYTSNSSEHSFFVIVNDYNLPVARAVEKSPEMLQLLHEIMFIEGIGRKYHNQIHDILCYVYGLSDE